ncbi:hypothetical protein ACIRG5_45635 [Lentzea sp. NPDC102401]|uniref:hypothetical protein n=1 Tax=Lentzea sp. NPDC102401 TaxID=3364128 RepID=UPI0038151EDB
MTSKHPQTPAEQDGVRALVAPYVHGAGTRQMCLFDLIAPAPPAGFAPEPELASYDWILFNSSGGKDSQVALSHGVALADAAGVDRSRIVVVYADLGRVVWPQTREIAEAQAGMLGVRFEVVSREKGDLLDYVIDKNRRRVADGKTGTQTLSWPAASARWCASDLKIGPVAKLMTRLVAETRLQRPSHRVRVLNCLGIRAEESPHRARKTAFGPTLRRGPPREKVPALQDHTASARSIVGCPSSPGHAHRCGRKSAVLACPGTGLTSSSTGSPASSA